MNKLPAILIFSLGMMVGLTVPASAQLGPLRLKVTKDTHKEMERGGAHHVAESVAYNIEVANATGAPVTNIVVHWALLVTTGHYVLYNGTGSGSGNTGSLRIVEGEHSCDIERLQKCAFDTDAIETANYTKQEYAPRLKVDIVGYCVEALVNGAVVASDIQPANAKLRIQEEKKKLKEQGRSKKNRG